MVISEPTRKAAQQAAQQASTSEEAKTAYQKIYQKAYRARQKAWKAQQRARVKEIREARERDRAGIAREAKIARRDIQTATKTALALQAQQYEQMRVVRTQLMIRERTMQASHLARAHFFFNQAMEQLYPDTDFFSMEPIPCSAFDHDHPGNKKEYE